MGSVRVSPVSVEAAVCGHLRVFATGVPYCARMRRVPCYINVVTTSFMHAMHDALAVFRERAAEDGCEAHLRHSLLKAFVMLTMALFAALLAHL